MQGHVWAYSGCKARRSSGFRPCLTKDRQQIANKLVIPPGSKVGVVLENKWPEGQLHAPKHA